jgi:hypothetical protein
VRALVHGSLGDGEPDAARAAADDGDLAFQSRDDASIGLRPRLVRAGGVADDAFQPGACGMSSIAADLSFSLQNSSSVMRFSTGSGLTSQPPLSTTSALGFDRLRK